MAGCARVAVAVRESPGVTRGPGTRAGCVRVAVAIPRIDSDRHAGQGERARAHPRHSDSANAQKPSRDAIATYWRPPTM